MRRSLFTILLLSAIAGRAEAAGDAAAGELVFKKCAACHMVGEGAKTKVGPVLNDLFGRTAGTLADYKFSNGMIEAGQGGLVWTEDSLASYLPDPRGAIKGTKMAFAGLKKPEEVENLIAYLLTFSPGYTKP